MHDADKNSMGTLARVFPLLASLKKSDDEKVGLVNEGIVEEVLMELGELDFAKGVMAHCNVALWRTRGEHATGGRVCLPANFSRQEDVAEKPKKLSEQFFISLQQDVQDWLVLGVTKTAMVYRT